MPLGATPDWPWISSQNPTPVSVAEPLSLVNEEWLMGGQAARRSSRACFMACFFFELAAPLQVVSGNSVIIVWALFPGAATTRWTSLSSSKVARRSWTLSEYVVNSTFGMRGVSLDRLLGALSPRR